MVKDYFIVAEILKYLSDKFREQPELDLIARQVNLSPYYLQKVFSRWVGVSPKKFIQYLTLGNIKKILDESRSVLDATYDSGLSSPGRTHDLFVNIESVTPGEYKNKGKGLSIYYSFYDSPFGYALLAVTDRGICGLSFHESKDERLGINYLQEKWNNAELYEDIEKTQFYYKQIFGKSSIQSNNKIPILLKGTKFQIKVWEALLHIPVGQLYSYNDIANMIGSPHANRAVGNAIGANPISYLIPCHRVIKNMGVIGNYHWGKERKQAIIGWEAAHTA